MGIYQQIVPGDGPIKYLKLLPGHLTSLTKVPETSTPLLACSMLECLTSAGLLSIHLHEMGRSI